MCPSYTNLVTLVKSLAKIANQISDKPVYDGYMDTAMRLRKARERAGLSQEQVAVYGGVGKQYISKLERRKNSPPTWNLLKKLAATCLPSRS